MPDIVADTINLLNDAKGWIIAITVVLAVVVLMIQGLKYLNADDTERIQLKKRIKGTAMAAIAIVCMEGIVAVILGYYI